MNTIPDIVHYINTGRKEDAIKLVAEQSGISREMAELASIPCCFNCSKKQVLYHLLEQAPISEQKILEQSGILKHDISDIHEYFNDNKDNIFFNYCNDFLTSYDACYNFYRNDIPPSLLAIYSCIDDKEYEKLPLVIDAMDNKIVYDEKKPNKSGIPEKPEKRNFLAAHNYNLDLAEKEFNMSCNFKKVMKWKILHTDFTSPIRTVRGYTISRGIPVLVETTDGNVKFTCIEMLEDSELFKPVSSFQYKASFRWDHNRLNRSSVKLLNETMAEKCDIVLFCYIVGKENVADYRHNWKRKHKTELEEKMKFHLKKYCLIDNVNHVWLFNDSISTMLLSKSLKQNAYKVKEWTKLLVQFPNSSVSLIF